MYCRRGNIEKALYIRLGRSLTVELGVVENEREVLPLFWCVALHHPCFLCRLTFELRPRPARAVAPAANCYASFC